jgi:phosphatidylglycerophosphatase A
MKLANVWLAISSVLGLGYMPKAPGTFGTLAAVPLWAILAAWPLGVQLAAVAGFIGFAILASARAEAIYGRHDVQHIVIDETAGLLVAAVGVPFRWPEVVAAVVLFRVFDIVKPQPVKWADERVPGGLGVVLDDVLAGVMAGVLLHLSKLVCGRWL